MDHKKKRKVSAMHGTNAKKPKAEGGGSGARGGGTAQNDVKGRAAALVRSGSTQEALFPDLGLPVPLEFEDATKRDHDQAGTFVKPKNLPGWCHLQSTPAFGKTGKPLKPKLSFCISHDGVTCNTRLLNRKLDVMTTLRAFGKPITLTVRDETIQKCAALYAMAPPLNGNGCIIHPLASEIMCLVECACTSV